MNDLSDAEWCFLDLLVRAKQKGVGRVNRREILHSSALPQAAAMKIVWAGLTLANTDLVDMHGQHDFEITPAGEDAFRLRFGPKVAPTKVADVAICLPGPEGYRN